MSSFTGICNNMLILSEMIVEYNLRFTSDGAAIGASL